MNKYVEIKSEITPENLKARVREYAHQVAAEQMRSMLVAQRLAQFHGLRRRQGAPLKGLRPLSAYGSVAKAPKSVWPGGSIFPRTPAQEAVQRIIDLRLRAFLKR
ncbi:MAG: hypothetical protein ABSF38_06675 [Verrucomicrobiota bacterium]|jgi:hypothetical protein